MLCRCNELNKFHFCWSRNYPISEIGGNILIVWTEAVFLRIAEDVRLQDLFIRWIELSPDVQLYVNEQLCSSYLCNLFISLRNALNLWNHVQDTIGAPGVQSATFALTCNSQLEEEFDRLIERVNHFIRESQSLSFEHQ